MLALIGILIRNSVILIVQIEQLKEEGRPVWDAVVEATEHRMRPIMLTAAAASLALIPIAREIFWGPMAYAMMGGIIVGTLLTLLFLPALYVAWFRIKEPEPATDNTHENPLVPESQRHLSADARAQRENAGGTDEGAPGIRENYNANYYGAFVRDLDGNKIEAVTYTAREHISAWIRLRLFVLRDVQKLRTGRRPKSLQGIEPIPTPRT